MIYIIYINIGKDKRREKKCDDNDGSCQSWEYDEVNWLFNLMPGWAIMMGTMGSSSVGSEVGGLSVGDFGSVYNTSVMSQRSSSVVETPGGGSVETPGSGTVDSPRGDGGSGDGVERRSSVGEVFMGGVLVGFVVGEFSMGYFRGVNNAAIVSQGCSRAMVCGGVGVDGEEGMGESHCGSDAEGENNL